MDENYFVHHFALHAGKQSVCGCGRRYCPKKFAKDPATYAKAVAADPAKYGIKPKQ